MCFVEYLAYVCGHTSTAVNRPCPMTTHLHTNPCCPTPACRPFLVNTMCHPCNRIMHGRRVNIAECEHRWMHERGACDCEVIFPALQQPRLIYRSAGENESINRTETGPADTSNLYSGPSRQEAPAVPTTSHSANQQFTQQTQRGNALPLFTEAQVGGNVEVAVRLTSLYAAEWTKDHAKLHQTGRCTCPVSFEKYQPLNVERYEGANDTAEMEHSRSSHQVHHTSFEPTQPTAYYNPTTSTAWQGTNYEKAETNTMNPDVGAQNPYGYNRTPVGHVARWAMDGPPGSLLDEILGPIGPDTARYQGHPVDVQTIHYQREGIPIAGNPIACDVMEESKFPSTVEYQRPESTVAGFPIGAGPEGESHAGDFAQCSLQLDLGSPPARRRRLSSEF
ncbi:hypothetical protein GGS21DRAFT_543045 [Xylaria nigripes]|nr:hypothetical protein GGS21DRAFT_543045 [Xylaria nigripes]